MKEVKERGTKMEKILDNAIPSTRFILFTGAGFTRNVGGYLARDMWAEIQLGLPDKYCGILKEIKREFDYEKLFQTVMKGVDYTKEEKVAFNKCVLDVYKNMDERVRDSVSNIPKLNFNINGVRSLLDRFAEEGNGKYTSFFFTLNQDIYIERQFYNILITLCVKTNDGIRSMGGKMQFQDYFSVVKKEDDLKKELKALKWEHERFHYVKLHGSFNWKDSDGNETMVIGTSKEEDIENEPILNWYKDLFENVLSIRDSRLLIIGYGFGDTHINRIILDSINKKNLRLYIISPTDPEGFRNRTLKNIGCVEDEDRLWDATKYYPYSFEKLFPLNGDSREYQKLIEQFFES